MKAAAAAAAVLLAVVFTWPLTAELGSAGRLDSGDARHGIWNVAWVAHALTSDPASLYDANIFHPHRRALAFSESNLVAGVLAIPVWLVTGNGLAAANSAILLSFVLSALAVFALVYRLTHHVAASAVAAVMFAYAPYAYARLSHMQLLMTFGLPLTMIALHDLVDRPRTGAALRLGGAMWLTALSCGYYGIFAGLAVGWGVLWFAGTRGLWRASTYWLAVGLALVTAGVLTVPFLLPYEAIRDAGFGRSLDDARRFAADWRAYLASPLLVHGWILPLLGHWREVLFPGFLPLAFAAVGATAWRRRAPQPAAGIVGFYVSTGLLAVWASFGPDAGLYAALFHALPFFDLIRAPGRFGVLVILAVATLAGMGVATTLGALAGRRRSVALAALVIVTLGTSTVGSLALTRRRPIEAAYARLAVMPPAPVAEFPYFVGPIERHRNTEYMLASIEHWRPLINGYSDHVPADAFQDGLVLARFPDEERVWDVLARRGARYVIVHWNRYGRQPDIHARVRAHVGRHLRVVLEDSEASLFELMPAAP